MVTPANNNYAPPKSAVADVGDDEGQKKASRSSRLGAAIIDGLLVSLPFIPCYVVALPAMMRAGRQPTATAVWAALAATSWFYIALLVLLGIAVVTAVLVHRNGQTIGKKWVGIKVVRKDGSRATLTRIFWLRYLLNSVITLVPIIGKIYGLVDSLFIFGDAKRCCHDYIADTIVVEA
jgi:uncharacterized RDD family membrane protein YckC